MKIIILLTTFSIFLKAQESYNTISISPYYTLGSYSDKTSSKSKALYVITNLNNEYIFSGGIDNIMLKHNQWDYKQNSIFLFGLYHRFPFSLKLSSAYVIGNYSEQNKQLSNYSDENISITPELIYKFDWNYIGLAFNYFVSTKGFQKLKSSSITLRFDKYLDFFTYFSIRPNFYFENSGKKLASIATQIIHWITPEFLVKGKIVIGNRRYYFDNDLLTIYNQYDIQKVVLDFGLEYSLIDEITFSGAYQYTKFEKTTVNYLVIGVRTKLVL